MSYFTYLHNWQSFDFHMKWTKHKTHSSKFSKEMKSSRNKPKIGLRACVSLALCSMHWKKGKINKKINKKINNSKTKTSGVTIVVSGEGIEDDTKGRRKRCLNGWRLVGSSGQIETVLSRDIYGGCGSGGVDVRMVVIVVMRRERET